MKLKHIILFFLFLAVISGAQSQTLIRGPYLQSPGQTSMILRWRTDVATDSRVYYGSTLGSTDFIIDSANVTTEHRVKITALAPHTKYFYNVGSSSSMLGATNSNYYFTTAPDTNTTTPVRLWAMGDMGHGNDGQALVRESYIEHAAATKPADLWLWLGDNVYYDGTDSEYTAKVFDSIYGYHHLFPKLPFASTSGNHDYNSICPWEPDFCTLDPATHTGPYLDIIDPPTHGELGGVPSNLKIFYSFDYGNIHFISLNSEIGSQDSTFDWLGVTDSDTSFTSPMIAWLKADLAATTKKWKIVFWHQMPYSAAQFVTDWSPFCKSTRRHFNPILEKYGVDLVLNGHDHSYQRSHLINGHYGLNASFTSDMLVNGTSGNDDLGEAYVKYLTGPQAGKGTVYAIAGNSSSNSAYNPVETASMFTMQLCDTCLGSLFIDIDGDRLDAHYLTASGVIKDKFTILKQYPAAINEQQNTLNDAHIFPNPFSETAQIEFTVAETGIYQLEITDLLGKKMVEENITVTKPGKQQFELNVLQLNMPRGSYRIKISGNQTNFFINAVKI